MYDIPDTVPNADPSQLNMYTTRFWRKNCGIPAKNTIIPEPTIVNATINRTIEAVFETPLPVTVIPNSLKKLVKKE
jgi:hypothetical protein